MAWAATAWAAMAWQWCNGHNGVITNSFTYLEAKSVGYIFIFGGVLGVLGKGLVAVPLL